jgi:NAD(P)-dependent dehydrogenase (short-subunit alcohol dehydrogenase family)
MDINLNGRVAIVTGAGRGLGRQYAIDLALRGARIVVNDIGTSVVGEGVDSTLAQSVVDEIVVLGGTAIANTNSVASEEGAAAIVNTALSAFGKVDILVNNAGIIQHKNFEDMSLADFEATHDVHVLGSFHCSKAVWPLMKANKFGRIVMATSLAGLFGNEGRTHYSSAKGALVSMAHVLSLEGRGHNILVNTIAPMAATRMSTLSMPPELGERMTLDWSSALVMFYCAETTQVTNQTISCGMGYYSKVAMMEGRGFVTAEETASPELIRDNFAAITEMADPRGYESAREYMQKVLPEIITRRLVAVPGKK